uniref:non-specific serine/threonine protein kinase n=1 Tax=Schistocephalus solidus TaxID=70667 RepID=A0A0X3PUI3_SCHSO
MRSVRERCDELLTLYLQDSSEESGSFNIEFLLDTLLCLYYECNLSQHRNERNCTKFCNTVKDLVKRIEKCRLSRSEFETVRLIGSGAFGEVSLVRAKGTSEVYALKSLHKYDMLKRSDRACFQEEREVLVKAMIRNSPWISKLYYTFQDEKYLYFVMKFYNGGDMLTMLSKFDDQIPEPISRFYLAEMVLAIHSLHELGYVHRDIKPDNVLIESSGHIVLADFGSCLRIGNDGLIKNTAAIGTPDYIAPEILRAAEDTHGTFGIECDYWSLGVVMFEMLFGETPFYSENLIETYSRIMNFEKTFKIPDETSISTDAKDLIKRFICDRKQRLGRNNVREIMDHPFFEGIDWEHIRSQEAPYKPEVKSPDDTSNFDIEETTRIHEGPPMGSVFRGCQVACIGFTFTKDSPFNQIERLEDALKDRLGSSGKSASVVDGNRHDLEPSAVETSTSPTLTMDTCANCRILTSQVQELQDQLRAETAQKQPTPASPKLALTVEGPVVADGQQLAAAEGRLSELTSELREVQLALGVLEANSIADARKISELTTSLKEERARNEKLQFDLRDYEEENEELCKRAADAHQVARQREAAYEELLIDLDEKRAELAAQRKLLDEYAAQRATSNGVSTVGLVNGKASHNEAAEKEEEMVVDSAAGKLAIQRAAELERRLNEALVWAEETETKLANCETYWREQQTVWFRERSEIQDRVHELVRDRTSALEAELHQERQHAAELQQRLAGWENRLVELNQMADKEWTAKDQLHASVLRLVADLQRLRNGSPEYDFDLRESFTGENTSFSDIPVGRMLAAPPVVTNGGLSNLDWRQRKSSKMNKMELSNLQVALNNEIRERELAQQQLRDLEQQVDELNKRLRETSTKLVQTEKEKNALKDQLLAVTSEARKYHMPNADHEEKRSVFSDVFTHQRTGSPTAVDGSPAPGREKPPAPTSLGSASGPTGSVTEQHHLALQTFEHPTKCSICSNLLLGQQWQGLRCQQCLFICHLQCSQAASTINCPLICPPSACVVNVSCGVQTFLEGPVKVPRGDIRRGWIQQYAFLSDMRLFIYDCSVGRRAVSLRPSLEGGDQKHHPELPPSSTVSYDNLNGCTVSGASSSSVSVSGVAPHSASASLLYPDSAIGTSSGHAQGGLRVAYETTYDVRGSPNCVIDLRAPGFSVSPVSGTDVIHAKRNEVPLILKIEPDDLPGCSPLYMLFDGEAECSRWCSVLEDNVKMLNLNQNRTRALQCLQMKALSDPSFPLSKNILSACVFDEHRLLLGAEDGLYTVDLRHKLYARVGGKKPVYHVDVLPEEIQLIVTIQEKHRRLQLILPGAIEGMNYNSIRVAEPKRCTCVTGSYCLASPSTYLLAAAGQQSVWVYEVARVASRHRRVTEFSCPDQIKCVNFVREGDWLAVGCANFFQLFNLWADGTKEVLLEPSYLDLDPCLHMFRQDCYTAQMAIPLSYEEFLLVFDQCAVYVNSQRRCTRPQHLFWPARPRPGSSFAYRAPFLYVFTDVGLLLFNVETGVWEATAGGSRTLTPLSTDAHICAQQHSAAVAGGNAAKASPSSASASGCVSLLYLPLTPRHTISAAAACLAAAAQSCSSSLRRRPISRLGLDVTGLPTHYLDLSAVSLLDANTRLRKSPRFSWLNRGFATANMMTLVVDGDEGSIRNSSPSSIATKSASLFSRTRSSTLGGASGRWSNTSHLSSKLISRPSDFRHIDHRGPAVPVHLIDLERGSDGDRRMTLPEARYSTGNFSAASSHDSPQQISLNSSSSLGPDSGSGVLASRRASADLEVLSFDSSAPVEHNPHPEPDCCPTPPADLHIASSSPEIRDQVLALFSALSTEISKDLPSPLREDAHGDAKTPTNSKLTPWSS